MRDYLTTAYLTVFAAAALLLAFTLGYASADDAPSCPTEDSCTVDYEDGRWTVTEDTP